MPPKKKSKAKATQKHPCLVGHNVTQRLLYGGEFDAPFVPVEVNPVKVDVRADVEALTNRVSSLEKIAAGPFFEINKRADSLEVDIVGLMEKYGELEGDLCRIVDLIVKGDIDSVKFKEILAKRQGKA